MKIEQKALSHTIILSGAISICLLTPSLYSLQILDRVISSQSLETLAMLTVLALLTLSVKAVLMQLRTEANHQLILSLNQRYLHSGTYKGKGEKQNSHIQNLLSIKQFILSPAFTLLSDAPWSTLYLIAVAFIHPVLAIVTLAISIILLFLSYLKKHYMATEITQLKAAQEQELELLRDYNEQQAGNWESQHIKTESARFKLNKKQCVITALSQNIKLSLTLAIMGIGALLIIQEQLSPGALIAASILSGKVIAPIEGLSQTWVNAKQAYQSYKALSKEAIIEQEQSYAAITLHQSS